MAGKNRTEFVLERPTQAAKKVDEGMYIELAKAFVNHSKNLPAPKKPVIDLHLNVGVTQEDEGRKQREELARKWYSTFLVFVENYPYLQKKLKDAGESGKKLVWRTEPTAKDFTCATCDCTVVTRVKSSLLDGGKDGQNRYKHPLYDGDASVHELVHFVYNVTNGYDASADPKVSGTEEAFCDYFAMTLTDHIKTNALSVFKEKVGCVLAYFGQDIDAVKGESEVLGDPKGHYARRDYTMLLQKRGWTYSEHFYGKQLCFVLRKLKSLYVGTDDVATREHNFDSMMWAHYVDRPSNLECVRALKMLASYVSKYDKNMFYQTMTPTEWHDAFEDALRVTQDSDDPIIDGLTIQGKDMLREHLREVMPLQA